MQANEAVCKAMREASHGKEEHSKEDGMEHSKEDGMEDNKEDGMEHSKEDGMEDGMDAGMDGYGMDGMDGYGMQEAGWPPLCPACPVWMGEGGADVSADGFAEVGGLGLSFPLHGRPSLTSGQVAWDAAAAAYRHADGRRLPYALQTAVDQLRARPSPRAALLLLLYPRLQEPALHSALLQPLLACMPAPTRPTVARWLARAPVQYVRQVADVLATLIAMRCLDVGAAPVLLSDRHILHAALLLQALHEAVEEASSGAEQEGLPYTYFYHDVLNERLNDDNGQELKLAYISWCNEPDKPSLCSCPCLLSVRTKSRLLRYASLQEQGRQQNEAVRRLVATGAGSPYLVLEVQRANLVDSAVQQVEAVLAVQPRALRKRLVVRFAQEEGVDEGGVQKEFFMLLLRRLFDADYGMFEALASRCLWFSKVSLDVRAFELVGVLLGLAIHNGVNLDVRFPPVVYRKLMRGAVRLADLRDTHPDVHRHLEELLRHPEGAGELGLVFQASYDRYGSVEVVDLCEGGGDREVGPDNVADYVARYVEWLLGASVQVQFEAFVRGFSHVCDALFFSLFRPEEVELLICGEPHLDFDALEQAAVYENGYTAEHPVVRSFWAVLHSLPVEEQRKFLAFATGSDRAPIGGLANLRLVVVKHGDDSDQLPQSHTCFNHLLLPPYACQERLRDRLCLAINYAEGFGML